MYDIGVCVFNIIALYYLDAENRKRIKELELTVARLEAMLNYAGFSYSQPAISQEGPPPLPPKGLPPSPKAYSQKPPLPPKGLPASQPPRHPPSPGRSPSATLAYTPRPPRHQPPTLQETPPPRCRPHPSLAGRQLATMAFTPQPPRHVAPTLQATPPPPRHNPPTLFQSPGAGPSGVVHTAPQLPPAAPPQKRRAPLCSANKLPSSTIDKSALSSVSSVVQANVDLLGVESKITTMASVLAREAYFGEEVMALCTAQGYGDKPGLPCAELSEQ